MADPWDGIVSSAGFDERDMQGLRPVNIHLPIQLIEALKPLLEHIGIRPRPPPPPAPDQTAAIERIVREQLQKQHEFLVERFESVFKRVESVSQSSVRNESHLMGMEEKLKSLDKTIHEANASTKESLTAEMKLRFEEQLRSYKTIHKVSLVQKINSVLKDMETAEGFPTRIAKLAERILYRLYLFNMLYTSACPPKPGKVSTEVEQIEDVSSKIGQLPEICQNLDWKTSKFVYLNKISTDLLHSYFQTGDRSGFQIDYSSDVTGMLCSLVSGHGHHFSIDACDLGFSSIIRSKANRDGNALSAKLKFPGLYFGALKGSVTVPLPYTNIKGNIALLHEYGAVYARVQAGDNPLIGLSCVFGLKAFSFGVDIELNPMLKELFTKNDSAAWGQMLKKWFKKYDAAVRYSTESVEVCAMTKNLTDTVSASAVYKWGGFAAGLESNYTFSNRQVESFIGLGHCFDPFTLLKVRVGLKGRVRQDNRNLLDRSAVGGIAVVKSWGRCSAGLSIEVDMHKRNAPRFGAFLKLGELGVVKREALPEKIDGITVTALDFALVQ